MSLIVGLLAMLGLSGGFDATSLPAPAAARNGAEAAQQANLRALVGRIAPDAGIENARYFTVGADVPWVSIVKRIDNLARERRAVRIQFAAADPGKVLVEGWRGRDGRGVVAAMLPARSGGAVAYYQVRFGSAR